MFNFALGRTKFYENQFRKPAGGDNQILSRYCDGCPGSGVYILQFGQMIPVEEFNKIFNLFEEDEPVGDDGTPSKVANQGLDRSEFIKLVKRVAQL